MGWVAIPESFGDDPRLIELGHEAIARLVRLWCYCGRHENDGVLSVEVLYDLVPERFVERFVERNLVRIVEGRADVVGFLDHNFSHKAREAQRAAGREAGRLSGKARREKALLERTNHSTNGSTNRRTPGPGPGPIPEPIPEEHPKGVRPSASPPVQSSEAEKPKKPRKPRSESKYHPNYTAALEAINDEFVTATGSKPDWTAAKEREAVNRLCGQWPVDEIRKRARRFWKDHLPAWVWRDKITTPSVSAFSTHFGELHVNEAANDGLSWFQRNPGWENERTGTNGTH